MRNYVLVHGGNMSTKTWNKLSGENLHTTDGYMGARYWDGTVEALESAGHRVFAPELSDEFTSNLSDHIHQIIDLIELYDLKKVILVGHSYGGFVITGTADKIPERIDQLVYIDSAIPNPGQSLMDILDSVYTKKDYSAALPDPSPPYTEKLYYEPDTIETIKKVYILCTMSEFIDISSLSKEKIQSDKGWTYIELESSHVPMADKKQELYDILLSIAL